MNQMMNNKNNNNSINSLVFDRWPQTETAYNMHDPCLHTMK